VKFWVQNIIQKMYHMKEGVGEYVEEAEYVR
jgi:hypothetical protein